MREIKFRAWDKFQAKMFNVQSIDLERGREKVRERISKKELLQYGLNSVELMQYTGLKDKNGKEIYEGDILTNDKNDMFDFVIVEYVNQLARFVASNKHDYTECLDGYRVAGNIYYNPELITN